MHIIYTGSTVYFVHFSLSLYLEAWFNIRIKNSRKAAPLPEGPRVLVAPHVPVRKKNRAHYIYIYVVWYIRCISLSLYLEAWFNIRIKTGKRPTPRVQASLSPHMCLSESKIELGFELTRSSCPTLSSVAVRLGPALAGPVPCVSALRGVPLLVLC